MTMTTTKTRNAPVSADRARIETKLRSAFGVKRIPFGKDLEPDELFVTDSFNNSLDRLRYLVDRRGIGAVFGAPGTGKSTLLRAFLGGLGKAAYSVCYVSHSSCAVLDLFREIARGFAIEPRYRKADVIREVKDRMVKLSRGQKIQPVLIIDDAHLLPTHVLDDLRLLTSFDGDSRDDLTMVLCGHPQLETNLRLAINEALAQRIVLRVHVRSLHAEDVDRYLSFRLELAGRNAKLFLPDAVEAIARAARGIPRLVDRLAEHSMLIALRGKRTEIDADIVTEAIDEVDP
jgi:type II secretory pathway predicted ATPase ExeA